jgi:purine-nucleoside phosphorylase
MTITFESIQRAADGLKASLPTDFVPKIGIIGGSGLSALEKAIEGDRHEISYEQIDGFPVSTGQWRVSVYLYDYHNHPSVSTWSNLETDLN